ncbi:MAG: hypothetical protein KAT68_01655 [Bacteroidales bacterium]|nr:hypothetical protein [Bacteroidales bacterium]
MYYSKYIYIIFILIILFSSCKNNSLDIDVSDIQVDIKINRFDVELFSIPLDSIQEYIPSIENKYGKFFELYNYKIIKIGGTNNKEYAGYLKSFLTDYLVMEANKKSKNIFSSIKFLQDDLTDAFKHYKFYFPDKNIPLFYTYISGFNQSIVTTENFIGIGLDKYLGSNCGFYEQLGLPKYIRSRMHKEKILSDCLFAWATTEFEYNDSINNLLNNMIYKGKIMYFIDAMLPYEPDSLKIGYSQVQLEWCEKNEEKIWIYFIENKLLFSTEFMDIKRYTDEAPFTSTFSHKSPGRTGIWIGWQIVKSFMKNNPDITIKQLMYEDDYQKILNMSKYNP